MSWKRPKPEERLKSLLSILDISELPSLWIDVGSGDGLFSKMIEKILPQTTVIQCDISLNASYGLLGIRSYIEKLGIRPRSVNGILCSQILHYLDYSQQKTVLNDLTQYLSHHGVLLIIEYEINRSYSWIPFPVTQMDLIKYAEVSNLWNFKTTKSISDSNRPKYSLLLQKR